MDLILASKIPPVYTFVMSTEQTEPWYKDGLQFTCTGCGNCCTGSPGVVWVNDEEIEAIAEYLDKPVGEIRLFHSRPYRNKVTLTEFANGDCTFFDGRTRRCTIYPVRPRQCRTWPFWRSNLQSERDWEQTQKECPGAGNGAFVSLEQIEEQAAVIDI
jgi:Fe-S-cluster containining protein